jgi:hypothetical protein
MLYIEDNKIYVFANNKFYELQLVGKDLVPAKDKEPKMALKNKVEISYEDAIKRLKKPSFDEKDR